MTVASLLLVEQVTFSGEPTSVTVAVTFPSGTVEVYTYGKDAEVSRQGVGIYQVSLPYTMSATVAAPYVFYWLGPPFVAQRVTLPFIGAIVTPPPPTSSAVYSDEPGLLVPGLSVLGEV